MKTITLLAIALCLSFAAGCERDDRTMSAEQAYVIALYDDSSALTDAGDKWGRAMEPWFHGKEADLDELVAADLHFKTTVESVLSKFESREIPDNPKAQQFAVLVTDYLTWQTQIRETYAKWHAMVRSENPAIVATRQTVIDELLSLNDEELEWKARINGLGESLGVTVGPEQ